MIQIAIWGIAMMLVVKAIDMLHQQTIAAEKRSGSLLLCLSGAGLAVLGAIVLVTLAESQVDASQNPLATQLGISGGSSAVDDESSVAANAMEAIADNMEAQADALEKGTR